MVIESDGGIGHKLNCGFVMMTPQKSDKDNNIGKPKNVILFVYFRMSKNCVVQMKPKNK